MGSRLFYRIYLSLVGAILATLALGTLASYHWLGEGQRGPYHERLTREARVVAEALPPVGAARTELEARLAERASKLGLYAALFDAQGALLATTAPGLAQVRWAAPQHGWTWTALGPAYAFVQADGRCLVLRAQDDTPHHAMFALAAVALFAALALASYPVARGLTRRLERLDAGVRQFGAGALGARVTLGGSDELARVAASFNWAAARIEALVEAQRHVLANTSHELRSPLARLRLALELLREEQGESSERRVREAIVEIGELDDLVEDVLIASRIEAGAAPGPLEEVDLSALLASEAARVGATIESALPLMIRSEPRMLKRMLRNLLENAACHGAGSPIDCALTALDGPASGVRLVVADRGPGVSVEERARIFERFYRARGAGRAAGSGLGLALVREIAEHHGGGAVCRAREGGGAIFEVVLRGIAPGASAA